MAIIDVVMPVFNCKKYIEESIRSIQSQTIEDIRIIIVDDGSTDGTSGIIAALAQEDSRIVHHLQKNAGIVAALNNGLQLCQAPYIARMDGDDIAYPDRFAKELHYLEQNQNCVGVSGRVRHINPDGQALGTITKVKDENLITAWSIPANEPSLIHPMLMCRRDAIQKTGGYRYIYQAEDTDLYWRLSDVGTLHNLNDILGDYRIHPDSLSSQSIKAGRQQAVWSQLAAISEQRRKTGRQDLDFSAAFMQRIRSFEHLPVLIHEISKKLSSDERTWFQCAVSAKLIEMSYYRPYEPEPEDIDVIRICTKQYPELRHMVGYTIFHEGIISCGIRLIGQRRFTDARRLAGLQNMPKVLARAIFRYALPTDLKTQIKTFLKRSKA